MAFTLAELAARLGATLVGEPSLPVERVRSPELAGAGEIAVIFHRRYLRRVGPAAAALVLPAGVALPEAVRAPATLTVDEPRRALITLLDLLHPEARRVGIEPGAWIAASAVVATSAWVASGARIEDGAVVGERVQVYPGCFVGVGCRVGDDSVLFPHVVLYAGTEVGCRVRLHAGVVLGADGFGFDRLPGGGWRKVPQVGRVEVGDDVEIGANTTIDRAMLEATRVGSGSKLDNLVQIGHNVELGARTLVAGLVGISGSATIGADSMLLGQVGVADHVTVAPGTVVGAQAGVHRDIGPGEWFGAPAIPAAEARRAYPLIGRLPALRRQLAELAARVAALEAALDPTDDDA
jgi:UDP-3-O-[3-hydroxymyristoyl] glucosamine N-acyltransferase